MDSNSNPVSVAASLLPGDKKRRLGGQLASWVATYLAAESPDDFAARIPPSRISLHLNVSLRDGNMGARNRIICDLLCTSVPICALL